MFPSGILNWYKARTWEVSAPTLPQSGWSDMMGDAMQITVKLFATFRVGRFAAATQLYPPGTRIADVIRELHIPEGEIGMIMLNGMHAESDQQLKDRDTLAIFPLVGGG